LSPVHVTQPYTGTAAGNLVKKSYSGVAPGLAASVLRARMFCPVNIQKDLTTVVDLSVKLRCRL